MQPTTHSNLNIHAPTVGASQAPNPGYLPPPTTPAPVANQLQLIQQLLSALTSMIQGWSGFGGNPYDGFIQNLMTGNYNSGAAGPPDRHGIRHAATGLST